MKNSTHTPKPQSIKRLWYAVGRSALGGCAGEWEATSELVFGTTSVLVLRAAQQDGHSVGTTAVVVRAAHYGTHSIRLASQLDELLDYAFSCGLHVGHIVISTGNSGTQGYTERLDLLEVERLVREESCADVVWHDQTRISRNSQVLVEHVNTMRAAGVEVHVAASGKVIDSDAALLAWSIIDACRRTVR